MYSADIEPAYRSNHEIGASAADFDAGAIFGALFAALLLAEPLTAVRRFFPRLFAAAEDAPVQTVAVRYRDAAGQVDRSLAFIDDDELHHHLWRLLGRERIFVDLTFGPPVPAAEPRERARLAREQIIASLG